MLPSDTAGSSLTGTVKPVAHQATEASKPQSKPKMPPLPQSKPQSKPKMPPLPQTPTC
jgi:hypothetical protein